MQEATKRLYFFGTAECDINENMLITTVDDNKIRLSAHDFSKANIARALQRRIGRHTTKDFIHYITAKLIPNCPVTVQDIMNAKCVGGTVLGFQKHVVQQPVLVFFQPVSSKKTHTKVPCHPTNYSAFY